MPFMTWDQSLATGNAEIDEQHKKLVALLNKVHEAMREGKGASILSEIFDELIAYTDYHFSTEERLFGPVVYPEKELHIKEHRDLVQKALELQSSFKAGTAFMTIEVLNFLKSWVANHIVKTDMTYKGII